MKNRPTLRLKQPRELSPEALAKLPRFRGVEPRLPAHKLQALPGASRTAARARVAAPDPDLIHITRAAVQAMDDAHNVADCPFCQDLMWAGHE